MRKALVLGVLVLGFVPYRPARASAFVGATEFTQILNNIQLVMSYAAQVQAVATQLHQYEQMVLEGKNLIEHPLPALESDLLLLFQANRDTMGLALGAANLDEQFRSTYDPYAQSTSPYYPKYLQWFNSTMGTLRNAMGRVGINADSMTNKTAALQRIRQMLQTPAGRNESIQLGNVIAANTLSAIDELQLTLSDDIATKAAYTGYQINKDQATESAAANAAMHVDRGAKTKGY